MKTNCMAMIQKFVVFFFAVLISACVTRIDPATYHFNKNDNKGIVVLTIECDDVTGWNGQPRLMYQPIDPRLFDYRGGFIPLPCNTNGDDRLIFVESAGAYHFVSLTYGNDVAANFPGMNFNITANKVNYLGKFVLVVGRKNFRYGIIDSRKVELPLLYKRFPNISPNDYVVSLMKFSD